MSDENVVKNTKKPSIVVMNQLPAEKDDVVALSQSPLVNSKLASANDISVEELAFLGHLVIRCNAEDKKLGSEIEVVLGMTLPSRLQSARTDEITVYWISPDEWLVVCAGDKAYDLEKRLDKAISGHCLLVNVSGGQTVLTIAGDAARTLLMKSTPYDVSEHNFPIGKVVTSAFGKSQAVICRVDENKWELIIRRSFADYIGLWLQKNFESMGYMG